MAVIGKILALVAAALVPGAALAQSPAATEAGLETPAETTVRRALETAKATYGPPARRPRCSSGSDGEIVVCAPDSSDQYRVPSTAESDPNSRAARRALDGNLPTAPQVGTVFDCSAGDCIGFGSVPPPAYMIDFSALPEPPPGSDADLIAKGEKAPR